MSLFAPQFVTVSASIHGVLSDILQGNYRLYLLHTMQSEAEYVAAADRYLSEHSADRRFESYQELCREGGRRPSNRRGLGALSGGRHAEVHSLIRLLNHAEHLLPFYNGFLSFTDETHRAVWPEVAMIESALQALDYGEVRGRFVKALRKKARPDELRSICQPVLETMGQIHARMGDLLRKRRSHRGPNFAPERFVEIVVLSQLMREGSKRIIQVAAPMDRGNLIAYFEPFQSRSSDS